MKHIGFKHQRESKQNSDNDNYLLWLWDIMERHSF